MIENHCNPAQILPETGIPAAKGIHMAETKKSQNSERKPSYSKPVQMLLRVLLAVTTLLFPLFMGVLTAAGWQHNLKSRGGNYPDEVFGPFVTWMFLGAGLLTLGAVLCLLGARKRLGICNLLALVCACPGIAACMTVLYRFCAYADSHGYSNQEMRPASDIYRDRLLPMILPFVLLCALALWQFFAYDARVYRKQCHDAKRRAQNAPAPKILGE